MKLFLFFLLIFPSLIHAKSNEVNKLLTDLVTNNIKAEQLTDDQLCESLQHLDLISTFNEHNKRNLNCLGITKPQKGWFLPSEKKAFTFLKKYQKRYKVQIPKYDLNKASFLFTSIDDTQKIYEYLNEDFREQIFKNRHNERVNFCLDWYGQVNYIAENQSKNLDGTQSWSKGSQRDGFVICSSGFNIIYLRALYQEEMREQIKSMIKNWIKNDSPKRDIIFQKKDRNLFNYIIDLNKILIAIELLHSSFNWTEDEYNELNSWMKNRALELFPADRTGKGIRTYCPTKILSYKDKREACKNGGILRAQTLLRIGIWTKEELYIDMAYLAFHRYMSGIREDGSNIGDSSRGCTAADYNIWATQFMSDFLFHWDRIGDAQWDLSVNNSGTPSDAIEYSLSLFENFEKINIYTNEKEWENCLEYKEDKTQEASKRQKEENYYPRISFAPYFFYKNQMVDELLNYDRQNYGHYTHQSGANYEIALLLNNKKFFNEFKKLRDQKKNDEEKKKQLALKKQEKERIEKEKQLVALNQKRLKDNAKRLKLKKQQELEEQIKQFNELILLSKYKKEDTFLVIPHNELDFIATQNPIINENREFEFKSARIRGELLYDNQNLKNMNRDKTNILYHFDNLDFKTAVLKDGETEAVGFFIADPPFDQFLLETNKSIVEKCGRLFKSEKWLVILTKTNRDNKKIINQQKCTRKLYLKEDEETQIIFSIISKSAKPIQYYLENNI